MQSIDRRLDAQERNMADLARSHTELVHHIGGVVDRVKTLEDAHQDAREERAARAERDKALLAQITGISKTVAKLEDLGLAAVKSDVSSIKRGFDKLFWIIVTGLVGGFLGICFVAIQIGLGLK